MTEETTDPGGNDPKDDEDEERGADVVHDGLEVTLVLCTLDEGGGSTDEGATGGGGDESKRLSALAAGGVEDGVADVLVDGEGLSGDGRLVTGDDGVADVVVVLVVFLALFLLVLVGVVWVFVPQLLPFSEAFGVLVVADEGSVGRDDLTLFHDDHVTGDEFTSLDFLFVASTDDGGLHGDVALEGGDDVCGLLLLVPTDDGVEQKDTDDDTKVNPFTETGGDEDGDFHDCVGSVETDREESEEKTDRREWDPGSSRGT